MPMTFHAPHQTAQALDNKTNLPNKMKNQLQSVCLVLLLGSTKSKFRPMLLVSPSFYPNHCLEISNKKPKHTINVLTSGNSRKIYSIHLIDL